MRPVAGIAPPSQVPSTLAPCRHDLAVKPKAFKSTSQRLLHKGHSTRIVDMIGQPLDPVGKGSGLEYRFNLLTVIPIRVPCEILKEIQRAVYVIDARHDRTCLS